MLYWFFIKNIGYYIATRFYDFFYYSLCPRYESGYTKQKSPLKKGPVILKDCTLKLAL